MYSVRCLEFGQVQCTENSTVQLNVVVFTPPICDCGICAHAALLPAVEEAKVQAGGYFMQALTVVDSLWFMPCLEGNLMVLTRLAYEMVSAEPQASLTVLASRVATAASHEGLTMAVFT